MKNELAMSPAAPVSTAQDGRQIPPLVDRAGGAARFAWDEFFFAEHHNPHTRAAYMRAARRFLEWAEARGVALSEITPGMVGRHLAELGGSPAKRNLHLSALRGFFNVLVNRHVMILNPAATVRGAREQVVEGKTPEISVEQARALLASVDVSTVVGLRDRAILGTLAYTACRAGAVAGLRLGDFQSDGARASVRFREKGGQSREIPARRELETFIRDYLEAADLADQPKDSPLFRTAAAGSPRRLTDNPLTSKRICEMVKRRLKDAGLPSRLSPHSFRVAAITDLLRQGVPLEDVQYLAGHAEPRTTRLYDRRQRTVARDVVDRISI